MGGRMRHANDTRRGHVGRRTRALSALISVETLLALALAAGGAAGPTGVEAEASRRANRGLVSALLLTDLALWPGASYSRHPSQADLFAPFSDHPAALEHSPAGSLAPAPQIGRRP